ncbi:MAG: MFS transporter [Acidimicrobiales bacterium]
MFGIIEGPEQGWTTGPAPIAFAVAALGLGLFVVWELRSEHPMLDPRFFKDRRFTLGSLTITVAFFGIFGMFFTLTQFLQFVQDHDALGAGLRILPYGLVLLAVSPRAADLAERFGAAKVMVVGMVIAAMGFATLATLEPQSSYLPMAVGLTLAALGTGLLMPPATTALVTSLPPSKAGVGSAMNDTTRELGGAIGIAVVGALMSIGYRNGIDDATDALDAAASETAADSLGGLLRVSSELEPAAADALTTIGRQAFTDGLQLGMFTAAGLLVATAALVAALHPRTDHPQAATGTP